jgi:endo-alpha-N-acetylgalactosaminidase
MFLTGFIPPFRGESEVTNPRVTISSRVKEVNKNVEHPGDGGAEPSDEEPVDITDNQLDEGDLKIISGDGSVTYNEDGSATFHVSSTQKNRNVYNKVKTIKIGIFEADITPGANAMNRFGLIYRVQNPSVYSYVGTGDQNNNYFGEIFVPANNWTSETANVPLKANKTYNLRLKFTDDLATLYINDKKVNTWTLSGGVDQAGLLGFEKSRGVANITISNIKINEVLFNRM